MVLRETMTLPECDPSISPTQVWPELPQAAWSDTCATLQLWMQMVGKVRMALMPPINHCWGVTLYPTARGLTTAPMPHGSRMLQIDFDFLEHVLVVETSDGARRVIPLRPMTVAAFYADFMAALEGVGAPVSIWHMPVEVAEPIAFDQDQLHKAYDGEYAQRFWRVLLQASRVFKLFRSRFIGKVSPRPLVLGSDGPGLHALFRPDRAGAPQHGRTAGSRNARRVFA